MWLIIGIFASIIILKALIFFLIFLNFVMQAFHVEEEPIIKNTSQSQKTKQLPKYVALEMYARDRTKRHLDEDTLIAGEILQNEDKEWWE